MKTFDLHGIRHRDVYYLLEKPCVEGEVPFVVITGKSETMKKIVTQVVSTFGLVAHEKLGNPGRVVISEDR